MNQLSKYKLNKMFFSTIKIVLRVFFCCCFLFFCYCCSSCLFM